MQDTPTVIPRADLPAEWDSLAADPAPAPHAKGGSASARFVRRTHALCPNAAPPCRAR
eukprot:gene1236-23413_t